MSVDTESQPVVAPFRLADGATFTGPMLRPTGHLAIVIRGQGLIVGPLSPAELRSFAGMALAVAGQLEAGADAAAAAASRQLDAIVGSSDHG